MQDVTVIDNVSRLMTLFEGFAEAYGQYDAGNANPARGGKVEIKATARTVRGQVTKELWQRHVDGTQPLGIIPIRDNDTCLWGVIDIDTYDLSFSDIVATVKKHKLPLVACRSKSGGVHLFLFLSSPVPAPTVQMRLKEMAALIGVGGSEVFPKQLAVQLDKGQLGNWLNMPYFGGDETDRYGIKPDGLGMTLGEFLEEAEAHKVPPEYLEAAQLRKKPERDPDFGDGPPCMQHLAASGFPEGMRNKGLFALGTFAKKKYGTRWKEVLERWNRDLFSPPLEAKEVVEVIKSLERKEYNYTCREQPLCAHCNSSLCRTRKFGVGGDDDFPVVTGLSVIDTEPPLWFMDVEDKSLELTTEELQNYRLFHKVCMEKLFICYRMMKNDDWLRVVSEAMRNAVRIQAPTDVSKGGQFYELVEDFVLNRHRGESREDILVGRPWLNTDEGRHYFRLRDLKKFLEVSNFRGYTDAQIITRIKNMGGEKHFFNIKGKGVQVWWVPDKFTPTPTLDLPELAGEPI